MNLLTSADRISIITSDNDNNNDDNGDNDV